MDYSPIIISLKTASASILFTFILGMAAAKLVFRRKNRHLGMVLDGLFTLPLILPPTVAGFFLLYLFEIIRAVGRSLRQ